MNGEKRLEGGDSSRKELEGQLRSKMQDLILRIGCMEGRLVLLLEIEKYLKETVELFSETEKIYNRFIQEVGLGEKNRQLKEEWEKYKKRLQTLKRQLPSYKDK